jgi:carnitine O-acetyltransferase
MKTFENQDKLPRLPIPPLENTLAVYLNSVKPHLSPKDFQSYSLIVKDFGETLGPKLQQRLIEYDKTQKNSWLEEWWLKYAYLSWRTSVMVHSNWYMLLQDHPNAPETTPYKEGYTEFQIYRAAGYTNLLLDYMETIIEYLIFNLLVRNLSQKQPNKAHWI